MLLSPVYAEPLFELLKRASWALTRFIPTHPSDLRVLPSLDHNQPPASPLLATHPQSASVSLTIATPPKKRGVGAHAPCQTAPLLQLKSQATLLFSCYCASLRTSENHNPLIFKHFRILLRISAPTELASHFFSAASALFAKNTRGWGVQTTFRASPGFDLTDSAIPPRRSAASTALQRPAPTIPSRRMRQHRICSKSGE